AGCEAAWHCARAGVDTLLITTSLDTSYNLARDREPLEPDTLSEPGTAHASSLMAELVPALRGPDGLVANFALHRAVKLALESEPLLHTLQSTVTGLIVADEDRLGGVTTWEGVARRGGLTALCIGSFFKARLSIGTVIEQQGRLSEMAYDDLYLDLRDRGVEFDARQFSLTEGGATPPYTVTTPVLAAGALAEDGFSVLG